jgi:hypothetical protein
MRAGPGAVAARWRGVGLFASLRMFLPPVPAPLLGVSALAAPCGGGRRRLLVATACEGAAALFVFA